MRIWQESMVDSYAGEPHNLDELEQSSLDEPSRDVGDAVAADDFFNS